MPELAYFFVNLVLGLASGKTYAYLRRGTTSGRFNVQQWSALIGIVAAFIVFAKFGVGVAVRHYKMDDFFVISAAVCMFAIFVLVAYRGSSR